MSFPINPFSFSTEDLTNFLAKADPSGTGTFGDILNQTRVDNPGEEATASDQRVAWGQLSSNTFDSFLQAAYPLLRQVQTKLQADGTVTNSIVRWSGTAWVEATAAKIDANGKALLSGATALDANADADDLVVGQSGGTAAKYGMTLVTDGTGTARMNFANGTDDDRGSLYYQFSGPERLTLRAFGADQWDVLSAALVPRGAYDLGSASQSLGAAYLGHANMGEVASVPGGSPAAGRGKFWIRSDTPNVPMFTDDAGTDFVLNEATIKYTKFFNARDMRADSAAYGVAGTFQSIDDITPNGFGADRLRDYPGSGFTVDLYWAADATGDVTWEVSFGQAAPGDTTDTTFATAKSSGAVSVGTADTVKKTSFTFSHAEADSLANGDLFQIKVVDSTDTVAGTISILGVYVAAQ